MPLQRYGTGFLKGLTQVAGQAKADLRAEEDQESKNNLAMAQLALQSGDPTLIQGALARLSDGFGGGKKRTGGKKGAGGGGDPQSMIAQLLLGGLDRGGPEQAPEGAPLRIQTAEEKTQAQQQEATAAMEGLIARLRDRRNPDGTPMFTTEQIAAAVGAQEGVPAPAVQFGPPGATIFRDGQQGATLPGGATPNVQTMTGNLAGDPPGDTPRLFTLDRPTGQWIDSRDNQPVTGEIQQRRAPVDPGIVAGRAATLTRTQQLIAEGETKAEAAALYAQVPPNYRDAFDRAIAAMPPTRQPFQQNIMARLWAQGNITGVQEMMRQAAVEGTSPITQQRFRARTTAIVKLTAIEDALNALVARGVDTNRFSGGVEDFARWLGTTTDPELVRLGSQVQRALNEYTLAVSGVQFSEREAGRYEGLFPNYRNTAPVNLALVQELRSGMQDEERQFWIAELGTEGAALATGTGAVTIQYQGVALDFDSQAQADLFLRGEAAASTPAAAPQ